MRAVLAAALLALLGVSAAAAAEPAQPLRLAGPGLERGTRLSLSAFRGRAVVVTVWASWCGGCIQEAPALARFAARHPRLAVVGVNTMDARVPASSFARRNGLRFPSIFDPHAVLFARLRTGGLPATLFLDRRHRVVARIAGAATRSQLEAGLRSALAFA